MSTGAITIVTGGAGALGSAIVRQQARHGERVVALDRKEAQDRINALEKEGAPRVLGLATDVTIDSDWHATLEHVKAKFGDPTGAVLTAGGWTGGTPIHAAKDDSAWQSMMQNNTETVYRALRALLPGMVERGHGSIVVVGARQVVRSELGAGAAEYTASKAAVGALTQAVAAEVLSKGVRVNAVLPSIIDTPANRAGMPDVDPRLWVAPDSLADVIAFLLSDAARDISGALIPVYGKV